MGTQMLTSTVLNYLNTILLLHIVVCQFGSPLASPNAVHTFDGSTQYPYESILAPLLKALSDHGETRWNAELKGSVKPEHQYMKYMTEVYKKSSRVQRSLDSNDPYNTLRLIKPLDKCLNQRNESSMQDLSYNLDRVGDKERLLKSVLLYSFDHGLAASSNSTCYLNIKEQEYANQCQLCPGAQHQVNFTVHRTHTRHRKNWVEVDITSLLLPLFKFHKRTVNMLINLTCSEDQGPVGDGGPATSFFPPRSPPLLLYLNDTSRSARRRSPGSSVAGQRSPADEPPTLAERSAFKSQQMLRHKRRRRRRASLKTKRAGQSLDLHLPELLPSSEFPTSDCALYDFKVRFSQLKLDHWIVFPPKYNPRYCRGICPNPMGFIYGSPVHTIVQNIIYEKLDATVPRPACIPSHYSPLSVMIFEDGSYVYKEFDDMVATRCTCR